MAEKTVSVRREPEEAAPATRETERYLVPPVDIYETADGLEVVVDLPGVEKGDVDVRVENRILTIRARPEHHLPGRPLLREFELLSYFRQFELSDAVDQERIEAGLENGVLKLRLPKAEAVKPRKIEVRVGSE